MKEEKPSLSRECFIRLPQIRYALEFNDPEFGLKHLRRLEDIIADIRNWEE